MHSLVLEGLRLLVLKVWSETSEVGDWVGKGWEGRGIKSLVWGFGLEGKRFGLGLQKFGLENKKWTLGVGSGHWEIDRGDI